MEWSFSEAISNTRVCLVLVLDVKDLKVKQLFFLKQVDFGKPSWLRTDDSLKKVRKYVATKIDKTINKSVRKCPI